MKRFKTVHYTIHSNKIKDARGIRFAVIADLHGMEFGPDNRKLLETIHRYRPDGILIAGDMIVRNDSVSLKTASSLLRSLAQQYPVYYALGNHEYKLYRTDPQENCMAARYQEYEKELKTAGIHILHNESCSLQVGKNSLTVYGLEVPLIYYKKPFSPQLKREEIRELIGEPSSDSLNILLAHSPKYGDTYFDWGADSDPERALSWRDCKNWQAQWDAFPTASSISEVLLRRFPQEGTAYAGKRRSRGTHHTCKDP